MSLFESTLLLLAIAVLLLQVARRVHVPYPALLALAGCCFAVLPAAPQLHIDPALALALFVAPAVMESAFQMPPRELLRNWLPLISLAVILVLLTTATVAWAGVAYAGLPLAAAVALGAIVAPPDAAAAAAVLSEFNLPRRMMAILQGESLLNDATALLTFSLASTAAMAPGDPWTPLLPRILIAVPGGAALGVLVGMIALRMIPRVAETLSHILVQFLVTFGTWLLAERLELSPITAVVALAIVAAQGAGGASARSRINSNAVWATVVFVLNVLAFLLMGLQAKLILTQLHDEALRHALAFAGVVLGAVIGVRFVWVMLYGFIVRRLRARVDKHAPPGRVPGVQAGVLVSWCGMRGLVTLATAFALPPEFPGREVIVLAAFTVVLGTLIIQGFTIRPLIAALRIRTDDSLDTDVAATRQAMLDAALAAVAGDPQPEAGSVRAEWRAERALSSTRKRPTTPFDAVRATGITAARTLLIDWRRQGRILDDTFHVLEDELDRAELHALALDSTTLES